MITRLVDALAAAANVALDWLSDTFWRDTDPNDCSDEED